MLVVSLAVQVQLSVDESFGRIIMLISDVKHPSCTCNQYSTARQQPGPESGEFCTTFVVPTITFTLHVTTNQRSLIRFWGQARHTV